MVESDDIETFSDDDELYRFIHYSFYKAEKNDYISPSSLRFHDDDGLSVDWDKKTKPPHNPHYTRNLRINKGKDPNDYGVIAFEVVKVKDLDYLIKYSPEEDNPAHSIIIDKENPYSKEKAEKLSGEAIWKIRIGEPLGE